MPVNDSVQGELIGTSQRRVSHFLYLQFHVNAQHKRARFARPAAHKKVADCGLHRWKGIV
jgi:hypothetical protein